MDSDESDFYGDPETVDDLYERVRNFDAETWIRRNEIHPIRPRRQKLNHTDTASHLHNPYSGVPYAWQLSETVDAFLDRLPPATTDQSMDVPWIFICNPWIARLPHLEAESQSVKGCEDEAPIEFGSQVRMVAEAGMERLELARKFLEGLPNTNKVQSSVETYGRKERKQALDDILNLAHAAQVRAGKWMIFCPPAEVNEIWRIIAKATANNDLGIAAKVAPRQPEESKRKERLVCVYTADFSDKADVARVVKKLRELGVVDRHRAIYYKPDAFTYIGISQGNPWGVRASIYSSTDVFKKEKGFDI
ncbi:hypothetical protein B0I35DRAFT_175549 [Stachybotrys elegans]|uniref:DUF1917 domain-containing protein n=1 Tax=Stachybotrys elegans TaxID=80388 RepID=A0A8K0T2W3_9HYPO|nr:hypothetical protein B0I35DRAFT_175549 [Stachybotrys elegans]